MRPATTGGAVSTPENVSCAGMRQRQRMRSRATFVLEMVERVAARAPSCASTARGTGALAAG
jgi:hypothetical protein